jgi:hypothetical protein
MKLSSRSALALLLGTALATSLASCDYQWSPGKNTQFKHGFTNAPGWHNWDVNRDSVNNQQNVPPPSGKGSAVAIKNGTVQEQIESAQPRATAGQTASGQLAPVDQAPAGKGNQTGQQPK